MLRRSFSLVLVLMLILTSAAFAVEATDAPGTPTQDVVLSLTANWLDEESTAYDFQVMPADQLTMDTVTEIYNFVYEENNRPVRYFPEEVQQIIAEMIGDVDPDALYMTEFMRLNAAEAQPEADLKTVMLLDVDYQPEELVVVVLGDTTDPEALEWIPVEAKVTELGTVECLVPQNVMEQLQGEDVLFSLLTIRKGNRGGVVTEKVVDAEHVQLPSKSAYDIVRVETVTSADGAEVSEEFELLVTDESEIITKELAQIRDHVKVQEKPICEYFDAEDLNEIQLLLGEEVDLSTLVVYEYLPLITKNYEDTYGDVIASFKFATPYVEGQKVVTLLGLPKAEVTEEDTTNMDWAVQRAEVKTEGSVEIVFDQLALIGMGEETGLMLVVSEPFAE